MSGPSPRKVLLIDDDPDSLPITRELLRQVRDAAYDLEWADTYEAGLEALRQGHYEACLLDYQLGAQDGLDLLRQAMREGCRVPIVMLTGRGDREVDLQAMQAGAADYLVKDGLSAALLERALRYAIERRRAEERRLRDEAQLRLLTQQLPASLWTVDPQLRFTSSLGAGWLGTGLHTDELVGQTLFQLLHTQDRGHPVIVHHLKALEGEPTVFERDWQYRTYQVYLEPIRDGSVDPGGEPQVAGAIGIALDITERRLLDVDLLAAERIQRRLLPQAAPVLPGFEIAGMCRPAQATGGDFFDYIPMTDGSLGIVVADVSSHGFAPALIMAETRRVLRTLTAVNNDLPALLGATNRALCEDTFPDLFVTVFFARLDPAARTLNYVGAGHEGFLLDAAGMPRKLASTSMPLGVLYETEFPAEGPLPLQPGDILVLLTDGIAEAAQLEGPPFGIQRALTTIQAHRDRPAAEILDMLYQAVRDYCRPRSHTDDITAVLVKVKGEELPGTRPTGHALLKSPWVDEP